MTETAQIPSPTCARCGRAHETGSALCPEQPLPPLPSLSGQVIADKYRVIRHIGEGGMAAVFEAENLAIGKRVALKVLLSNLVYSEQAVDRFYREARTVGALGHENIVQVFDFGLTEQRVPFMVMELLEGKNLGELLSEGCAFDVPRAVFIVSQVLAGLEAAHRANVVHRDLKPENVLIMTRSGGRDVVKLLDFGISLVRGESSRLTAQQTLVGTAQYMAPEQIVLPAEVDQRADVHAAGVLLYELLAGSPAFPDGDLHEILLQIVECDPQPLAERAPHVPPELCTAVHRALEKDPAARFPTAADMLDAIAPFLEWRTTGAVPMPRPATDPARLGAATTMPAIADVGAPGDDDAPGPASSLPAGSPRRRAWPLVAVPLGGAALLALILLGLPQSASPRRQHQREPALPGGATVTVRIEAVPPEATLALDGRPLSANPAVLELERSEAPRVVQAIAPGYRASDLTFRTSERTTVRLDLVRLAPAATPEATAAPPPNPASAAPATHREPSPRRARSRSRPRVIGKNPYR